MCHCLMLCNCCTFCLHRYLMNTSNPVCVDEAPAMPVLLDGPSGPGAVSLPGPGFWMRPAGTAYGQLGGGLGRPGLGAVASTWGPTPDDRRGGTPRPDPGRCSQHTSFARAGAESRPRPWGPSCEPNPHRPYLPRPRLPVVRSWPLAVAELATRNNMDMGQDHVIVVFIHSC